MKPNEFLGKENEKLIAKAIEQAESQCSGEIRVHIESNCKSDVLDRAAAVFKTLDMHKTKERNGVLFYLSLNDRKFALIGDVGINAVVPADFWDSTKEIVINHFKNNEYTQGLSEGIAIAGEHLKKFFPHQKDDVNELPDDISYGK
jgi:uncharacterized membrane protein